MTKFILSYIELEEDSTKQIILDQEKSYGYNHAKPLSYDSDYIDLYNTIIKDKAIRHSERFLGFNANKNKIRASLSIWEDLGIKLQEIAIIDGSFACEDEEFIATKEFLDAIKITHPSELPIVIKRNIKPCLDGNLKKIVLTSALDGDGIGIVYRQINLSRTNNNYASCVYNHELTHTQIVNKGSNTSILDSETIPIFIESIFASKMDQTNKTLIKMRSIRLLNIAQCFSELLYHSNLPYKTKIEADTYIKSTLQAIELSNIYLNGNENIQQEMIAYINKIFSEERTVQEMLDKYDANLEAVSKDIKRLKIG